MRLSRENLFVATLATTFLLPLGLPNVGLDYQYWFILVVVLFAWFLIKWESVKSIPNRSNRTEKTLGLAAIAAVYGYKTFSGSPVGLLDLIVIFLASVVLVYGIRSMKLFWVPATYGLILLAGYQIENYTPNYVQLQDWLAGVMAGAMHLFGIRATASGELVTLTLPSGVPALLDVSSDCTGLQGILAFGMLSTMTLLDFKPRMSRIIPIFAIGFLGAFLINILRLVIVFLVFEFVGIGAGTDVHVYAGYLIFIAWVLVFWSIAFKYMGTPTGPLPQQAAIVPKITT